VSERAPAPAVRARTGPRQPRKTELVRKPDEMAPVLNVASGRPLPLTVLAGHVEELLARPIQWDVVEPEAI
jgi:hypothetical protein